MMSASASTARHRAVRGARSSPGRARVLLTVLGVWSLVASIVEPAARYAVASDVVVAAAVLAAAAVPRAGRRRLATVLLATAGLFGVLAGCVGVAYPDECFTLVATSVLLTGAAGLLNLSAPADNPRGGTAGTVDGPA